MKHCLPLLAALAMLLGTTLLLPRTASAAVYGYYEYVVNEDGTTCTIEKYNGNSAIVEVPGDLQGYTVTRMYPDVFSENTTLTEITLPETLTVISQFNGCSNLTKVNIPSGVTELYQSAFEGCASLAEIELPAGLTALPQGAFQNCTSLKKIDLPAGLTAIGGMAFYGCSGLQEIDISKISTLGAGAFWKCTGLTEVTLPAGLDIPTEYDEDEDPTMNWFSDCTGLTKVNLPEDMTIIPCGMLSGCTSLEGIDLPAGVVEIRDSAFSGCTALRAIELPAGLTSLGNTVFCECSSLAEIDLPEGITKIGYTTFRDCDSLTAITVPKNVTEIGYRAFIECDNLERIYLPDNITKMGKGPFEASQSPKLRIPAKLDTPTGERLLASGFTALYSEQYPDYNFRGVKKDGAYTLKLTRYLGDGSEAIVPEAIDGVPITALENNLFSEDTDDADSQKLRRVVLPDCVTAIGSYCFYGCGNLADVNLPKNLVTLGNWAFTFSGVTRVEVPGGVRTLPEYAFWGCQDLVDVTLNEGLETIKDSALGGIGAETLSIPKTVLKVEDDALSVNNSLTDLYFYGGETQCTYRCFSDERTGDSPTIHCREGSPVDGWAKGNYPVVYITDEKPPMALRLPGKLGLQAGKASRLEPEILYADDDTSIELAWNSSDDSVITVEDGVVTAVGSGAATVTVASGDASAACEIVIWSAPSEGMVIPDTITAIREYAFQDDISITFLVVPEVCKSIGEGAFCDCSSLKEAHILSADTTVGADAFDGCAEGFILYAPAGSPAAEYAESNSIPFIPEAVPLAE